MMNSPIQIVELKAVSVRRHGSQITLNPDTSGGVSSAPLRCTFIHHFSIPIPPLRRWPPAFTGGRKEKIKCWREDGGRTRICVTADDVLTIALLPSCTTEHHCWVVLNKNNMKKSINYYTNFKYSFVMPSRVYQKTAYEKIFTSIL